MTVVARQMNDNEMRDMVESMLFVGVLWGWAMNQVWQFAGFAVIAIVSALVLGWMIVKDMIP